MLIDNYVEWLGSVVKDFYLKCEALNKLRNTYFLIVNGIFNKFECLSHSVLHVKIEIDSSYTVNIIEIK